MKCPSEEEAQLTPPFGGLSLDSTCLAAAYLPIPIEPFLHSDVWNREQLCEGWQCSRQAMEDRTWLAWGCLDAEGFLP